MIIKAILALFNVLTAPVFYLRTGLTFGEWLAWMEELKKKNFALYERTNLAHVIPDLVAEGKNRQFISRCYADLEYREVQSGQIKTGKRCTLREGVKQVLAELLDPLAGSIVVSGDGLC